MKWFTASTLNELRRQYKMFLVKYHPDNNPGMDTTKDMQEINAEYDVLLNQFAENQSSDVSAEKESELKKVLNEVIKIKADILIELVGTWIWISGNTHPVRGMLSEIGFKWAHKKRMWYWGESGHKCTAPLAMEDIRAKYGSTVYRSQYKESIGTRETLKSQIKTK